MVGCSGCKVEIISKEIEDSMDSMDCNDSNAFDAPVTLLTLIFNVFSRDSDLTTTNVSPLVS